MPYAFRKKERPGSGLRRIAREEADRALRELGNPSRAPDKRFHEARKSCKKLRALLRLLRPRLKETFKKENRVLREAARSLSRTRDSQVLQKLYADLMEKQLFPSEAKHEASRLFPLPSPKRNPVPAFRQALGRFRRRIAGWNLEGLSPDTLAKSLCQSRRRAQKAMKHALKTESDDDLHEWRKQAKILRYHLDLSRRFLPKKGRRLRRGVKKLEEQLGQDHDLAVLASTLGKTKILPAAKRKKLQHLAERRRHGLRKKSAALGRKLLKSRPALRNPV